jgi:uracil-DNA glycosylase
MTPLPFGSGNPSATYLVVGDCYSYVDDQRKQPFSDAAGTVLNKLLQDAGIQVSDCYFTNLVNASPPYGDVDAWFPKTKKAQTSSHITMFDKVVDPIVHSGLAQLHKEIALVNPKAIITLGNAPLWALTGRWGALAWRGSLLTQMGSERPLIPTLHPKVIQGMWEWRVTCLGDVRRARRQVENPVSQPDWRIVIRPGLDTVLRIYDGLQRRADSGETLWIDVDIETIPDAGHMTCIGFSWSDLDAICLPLTTNGLHKPYWSAADEAQVIYGLYRLLTHRNVKCRLQNGLYDVQYIFRWWHFIPNVRQDTMISHHSMWAGMKKSLAFQASMYSEYYQFWKDMRKADTNKDGE